MTWNNEQVPQQWNEGITCPVYKKGNRLHWNNYRPITLLNIAYKIFAILLNKRLMENIENKLEDNQTGFRPNRSTIDNIFLVRQISRKAMRIILICITYLWITHMLFTLFIGIK